MSLAAENLNLKDLYMIIKEKISVMISVDRRLNSYVVTKIINHENTKSGKHEIIQRGSPNWNIGMMERNRILLLRQLNTLRVSFPRRRESRKTLDAGSSPA
ncbi:MAG: hypothetical protein DRI24_17735 [Deltaproteobacteria bacterium]|nr:MAG: hypothetical protein DRI24_17735 [Deltaproteobacteria bacterium]